MMEEVQEATSALSVHGHNIKVTDVVKDGDTLTFLIVSQKLSGTGEYHVDRTYDDVEWLQQHLFSQEDVPGLHGVIFPPIPAKPQVNATAKSMKQLGFLGLDEWQPYCKALETFLRQVASHDLLKKNKAVEIFLTSSDVRQESGDKYGTLQLCGGLVAAPHHKSDDQKVVKWLGLLPHSRQRVKKNIFNRLSQAVEEMRKEGHKDVDEFFQAQRDQNLLLTGLTKNATERFLEVVLTEQKIAVACGHFSAALHLCVEAGEDPVKRAFSRICVKLSEVFESMKKNMVNVAVNNVSTLGLGLDLESRYQEAEKEMLFRRTCKLVELEAARRNAEKAKPVRKAAMEEVRKAAESEFDHISRVAKQEIAQFERDRVQMLQQALVQWCEQQLLTAKESAERFDQYLQVFRAMA